MTRLKIFTLNVWALPTPIGCKLKKQRIQAIGEELAKGEYDIVLLQEVWRKNDYKLLSDKICPVMPYTHYFYSGMIGSGICIFSKGQIKDVQFFRFNLNGHSHKLQHGDWYGGKGIGMCQVEYKGLNINVYSAHLHAEYNRLNDEYRSHRVAQAFELSQVVKLTSHCDTDLVILGGDLNLEAVDLGFQIICANAELKDAWIEKVKKSDVGVTGNTCEVPSNSFADPKSRILHPDGKRIDYVLYKSSPNKSVICEDCFIPFSKIPNESYNFSDHEPITATLDILDNSDPGLPIVPDKTSLSNLLTHAITDMDTGLIQAAKSRTLYLTLFIVAIIALWVTSTVVLPYGLDSFMTFIRIALIIGAFYSLMCHVVLNKGEENSHREIRLSMETICQYINTGEKKLS